MTKLINQLIKLLEIKSIVTLSMTFTFVYMTIATLPIDDTFKSIFSIIIGFYFGTQFQKSIKRGEEDNEQEKSNVVPANGGQD